MGQVEDLASFVRSFDVSGLPLVKILVEQGPYGLALYAQKEWDFAPDPKGYTGKCHLCVEVRRHLVSAGAEFSELSPRAFYDNLRSHLPPLSV